MFADSLVGVTAVLLGVLHKRQNAESFVVRQPIKLLTPFSSEGDLSMLSNFHFGNLKTYLG